MVKIYWFHGSSSQRLCGWVLPPLAPGQFSHLAPGGRQTSHTWTDPWWPLACVGGPWFSSLRFRHLAFSVSEAEEATVTRDGCLLHDLSWQENVFVGGGSVAKIGWSWSFCPSKCRQRSMQKSRNVAALLKMVLVEGLKTSPLVTMGVPVDGLMYYRIYLGELWVE